MGRLTCEHERRSVHGVVLQHQDGSWHATFSRAGSLVALAVTHCPWCGDRLHGRPSEPSVETPAVAVATLPRGTPWPRPAT